MFNHIYSLLLRILITKRRNLVLNIIELFYPSLVIFLFMQLNNGSSISKNDNDAYAKQRSYTFTGSLEDQDPMNFISQLQKERKNQNCSDDAPNEQNAHLDQFGYLNEQQNVEWMDIDLESQMNEQQELKVDQNNTCQVNKYLSIPIPINYEDQGMSSATDQEKINFSIYSMILGQDQKISLGSKTSECFDPEYPYRKIALINESKQYQNSDDFYNKFKDHLIFNFPFGHTEKLIEYNSENEFDLDVQNSNQFSTSQESYCLGIVFKDLDISQGGSKSNTYDYKIRMDGDIVPETYSFVGRYGQYDFFEFAKTEQLPIQLLVDNFIRSYEATLKSYNSTPLTYTVLPLKYESEDRDYFMLTQISFGFLITTAMFVPSIVSTVSLLVKDKESRVREGMTMMGMNLIDYQGAITIYRMLVGIIQAFLIALVYKVQAQHNCDLMVIVIGVFILIMQNLAQTIMMSTFFDVESLACVFSSIMYFLCAILLTLYDHEKQNNFVVRIGSLAPIIFAFFNDSQIFQLQFQQGGATWSNINANVFGYTMLEIWGSGIISTIFMSLISLYLEYALPKEQGTWYGQFFFVNPEFQGYSFRKNKRDDQTIDEQASQMYKTDESVKSFEEVDSRLKELSKQDKFMEYTNLRKEFNGKVAVDGASLRVYEGEIFSLLGHNGAGKTTTLNMISGLIRPDHGAGSLQGVDIFGQMSKIRTTLGVCPQLDVLFEDLDVREHLEIFQEFKHPSKNFLQQTHQNEMTKFEEIDYWLDKMMLREFEHTLSQNLPGGSKRRLSVAIALLGGSRLVLLDEPSSGMDVAARYQMWDLLRDLKSDRIIILTTHFMDEAEYLGDRVAIMNEGKVEVCGTSHFLKDQFGGGYKLILTLTQLPEKEEEHNIFYLLKQFNLQIIESHKTNFTVEIPKDQNNINEFFKIIDLEKDKYNIETQVLNDASLEDVFLNLGKLNHHEHKIDDIEIPYHSLKRRPIYSTVFGHFSALLIKRLLNFVKDSNAVQIEILLPIIALLCGVFLIDFGAKQYQEQWPLYQTPDNLIDKTNHDQPLFLEDNITFHQMKQSNLNSDQIDQSKIDKFISNFSKIDKRLKFDDIFFDSSDNVRVFPNNSDFNSQFSFGNSFGIDNEYFEFSKSQKLIKDRPIANLNIQNTETTFSLLLNYNHYWLHGLPMIVNQSSNSLLKLEQESNNIFTSTKILHANHPLIRSEDQFTEELLNDGFIQFLILTILGISLIPTGAIVIIVKEHESGSKHQQYVSGVSMISYWVSNFVFDFLKLSIVIIAYYIIILGFDRDFMHKTELYQLHLVIISFICQGQYSLALVQLLSYHFSSLQTAMITVMSQFQMSAIAGVFGHLIIQSLYNNSLVDWQDWVFMIISPSQNFIKPLERLQFSRVSMSTTIQDSFDQFTNTLHAKNAFEWSFIRQPIQSLVMGSIFILIITFYELNSYQDYYQGNCKIEQEEKHPSVQNLENEVNNIKHQNEKSLILKEFSKNQNNGTFTAVNNLTQNVNQDECLVIFGTNGAGKSSMFKCISGQNSCSHGNIQVKGIENQTQNQICRLLLGNCPQSNSIMDLLTPVEHLYFQSRLKFIDSDQIEPTISSVIRMMNLENCQHTPAGKLSGGNKRKLMVAIALLGFPALMLLDEPSTGVDPAAKRFMWNAIKQFKTRASVVMSTHSVDEAQALADKIAIMDKGQFKFWGTLHQLIENQSQGIQIDLFLSIRLHDIHKLIEKQGQSKDQKINIYQISSITTAVFNDKLNWQDISSFGFGSIISETLDHSESNHKEIDSEFQFEFIQTIIVIIKVLKSIPLDAIDKITVTNNGKHLKLNLIPKLAQISAGYIFGLIKDIKDDIGIQQYSISTGKLDNVYKNLFLNEENQKSDDCTIIYDKLNKIKYEQETF